MKHIFTILFVVLLVTANSQITQRCPVCPPSLQGVPDGYVLTDSSGYARWQAAGGGSDSAAWSLTGNSGTNPATNLIGTRDAQLFRMQSGFGNDSLPDRTAGLKLQASTSGIQGFFALESIDEIRNARTSIAYDTSTGALSVIHGDMNFDTAMAVNVYANIIGIGTVTGVPAMVVLDNGNVGIGTTTPTYRLHQIGSFISTSTGSLSYNFIRQDDDAVILQASGTQDFKTASLSLDTTGLFSVSCDTGNISTTQLKLLINATQGAGKVLTSDADGNATWQTLSAASGTGIPAYADNAAAFAAIGAGKLYYTDVAGEHILKLSH